MFKPPCICKTKQKSVYFNVKLLHASFLIVFLGVSSGGVCQCGVSVNMTRDISWVKNVIQILDYFEMLWPFFDPCQTVFLLETWHRLHYCCTLPSTVLKGNDRIALILCSVSGLSVVSHGGVKAVLGDEGFTFKRRYCVISNFVLFL